MHLILHRLGMLCLSTCVFALIGASTVLAGVIDYPDGSTNTNPIVLTDNSTQLQVLTGAATQSGVISENGGSYGLEKIGTGTLTLTGNNTYSGGTTITAGTLGISSDMNLGATTGTVTLNGGTLEINPDKVSLALYHPFFIGSGGGTFDLEAYVSATNITGPGHLTLTGPGQFDLYGNNTYSGGTTIMNGELLVDGTLAGDIIFQTPSTILFRNYNDSVFAGNISGPGSIQQVGYGTLTLTGHNTYSGSTEVANGTLAFSSDDNIGTANIFDYSPVKFDASFTSALNYLAGGRLDTNGNTVVLSGLVEASEKIGAGTLIITGTDDGISIVSGGTLQIGDGGTTGSIDTNHNITDNAALIFDRSDDINFTAVISGSGTLTQAGSDTLTLTSTNTYSGGTMISSGVLQVGNGGTLGSISGNITNNATLIFNRSYNTTFAGAISGNGGIIKLGNDTLTLTGISTYSGTTSVSAGTLSVNGSIAHSAITVNTGATLSGSGTVGMTAIQPGATLAPGNLLAAPTSGNAIGTLNVNGDLVLAPGATYSAGFGYNSDFSNWGTDKTVVTGNAAIAGNLSVNFSNYGSVPSQILVTLINSGGELSGTFDSVNVMGLSGSGYHLGGVSYDAHDVYIDFARDIFMWAATPVSSDWSDTTNWKNGEIPSETDPAVFGATSQPTVSIPGPFSVKSLQFNADAPAYTFTIAANNLPVPADYNPPPPSSCTGFCVINAPLPASLTLADGIVDNSRNPPSFMVGGVFGPSELAFTNSGNAADANVTVGAFGTVSFSGNADAGSAAALTALKFGIVDFSATTGANGDNNVSAGSIAGAGSFVVGTNNLVVGALNTSTEVSGVISGNGGGLTKIGTGTLTLSGTNIYTGTTIVSAGMLNVTGAIAGSSVSIANGGTLTGTGETGSVSVASGGVLNPSGANSAPGTLTVQGNLTLASGSATMDYIAPTTSSTITVTGTANLNGTLVASAASGTYTVGQRYTLLSAGGGVSGTFAAVNTLGLPSYVKGRLTYEADDVYLYLDDNALLPLLPAGASNNVKSVAGGIDAAIKGGSAPSSGFLTLFGLSGNALNGAMDQLSGQIANGAFEAANQTFAPFLALLT